MMTFCVLIKFPANSNINSVAHTEAALSEMLKACSKINSDGACEACDAYVGPNRRQHRQQRLQSENCKTSITNQLSSSRNFNADFDPPHLHSAPSQGVTLVEFRGDLWHQKTRVPGLSCGVVCVTLRLAVLVELRLVTDGQTQTDRYTQAHGQYHGCIASRGKKIVSYSLAIAKKRTTALHRGMFWLFFGKGVVAVIVKRTQLATP